MSASSYTPWHPRWYRPRVSTWWWLGSWPYLKFILRELSSIAVGLAVAMTLVQIAALHRGPGAYERFQHAPIDLFQIHARAKIIQRTKRLVFCRIITRFTRFARA